MPDISVITLARGRPDHLVNLVLGLCRQTYPPVELLVAVMQDQPYALPDAPFAVRQLMVAGGPLPLAASRNRAAQAARGLDLVFLDMDCVAAPSLIADYAKGLLALDGLLMGDIAYLPPGVAGPGWTDADFAAVAVGHPARPGPRTQGIETCDDYRCFWSLAFAIRRATFRAAGGFDERFTGYGGEDTDFGKSVVAQGIPLAWLAGARAYHQHHPHHMPPVHHLDSVVRNAQLFERKWGTRPMGDWLHAFRLMGLIDDPPGAPIRILRRPGPEDLVLTGQQAHQPYADATRVIRLLEASVPRGSAHRSASQLDPAGGRIPGPATI